MSIKKMRFLGITGVFVIMLLMGGLMYPQFGQSELSKGYSYSYPTKEKMKKKFESFMDYMEECKREMKDAANEGRMQKNSWSKPALGPRLYIANVESKKENAYFCIIFNSSKAKRVGTFLKKVFLDKERKKEIREEGYDLYFNDNGDVTSFSRRSRAETLKCYPSGKLKRYYVGLENNKYYSIVWNEDGTIEDEATGIRRIGKKRSEEEEWKLMRDMRKKAGWSEERIRRYYRPRPEK